MIDDKIFDEMNLPLANAKEELSIISENHFKPLFDVQRFVIRAEQEKDKGIDFQIEIKHKNRFTNFRFVVQLKATDSKEANKDGSISLQIDTGNINYLLNNPMPAFYVLYFKETNTFYYENINDFTKFLNEKDSNWNTQASHVLRFSKTIDASALELIYHLTLQKGKFQRTINEKVIAQSVAINTGDKILIDADFNVTDDNEIRRLIEDFGLLIINEGKWKEVIYTHKKASGNVAISSKYNLVLGIANYYSGNLMEALLFFRAATNLKSELSEDLRNHLLFFETTVKYSIGLITDEEYFKKMQQLENDDNVGLYIKLENAKRRYIESLNINSNDCYEKFVSDINEIINDPKANDSIILDAKCELVLFEGYQNNMEYVKSVSLLNALETEIGPNARLRTDTAKRLVTASNNWFKNVQQLKEEASKTKNYIAYYNATINEVKVVYEFEVFTATVSIVQDLPGVPKPGIPDKQPMFERMLEKISKAIGYFNHLGHIENTVAALSTKYEILHYLGKIDDANKISDELQTIIEAYDLTEHRRKFEYLRNNGTTHQQFKIWKESIFGEREAARMEYEALRNEMISMDEEEKKIDGKQIENKLLINLFPIGYFWFPVEKKNIVYKILNVTENAKKVFEQMFETVTPVANIFYNSVNEEGFIDGKLADNGIECWRNIHRIRKAFYENKFYRDENIH